MVAWKQRFRAWPVFLICIILSMISCEDTRNAPQASYEKTVRLSLLSPDKYHNYLFTEPDNDVISTLYSDKNISDEVKLFFTDLAGSGKVASAILDNSVKNAVPVGLAFALAFEESEFRADAVHVNENSVDRGLFQLNSKSFPALTAAQAFDPARNAQTALDYFGDCLKKGKNEVTALAMYNAGHNRVSGRGTPRATLDYIARIQKYRQKLMDLFSARLLTAEESREPLDLKLALAFY
jgi:soluble lytic murein transglycosylase-like protein